MGGAFSTDGRIDKCTQFKVLVGKCKGRRPLRELGVDVRIILKWILKT
jgi:hypothetical protein